MQPSRSPDQDVRSPKQVQRRLTVDQQAELLERYLAGERAHLLAEAFEINRTTVARLLTDTGLRRPRSLTDSEIAEAVQLYGLGWSCQRIGVQLRLPWSRS